MKKTKIGILFALMTLAGAASAVVLSPSRLRAERAAQGGCSNTFCTPGATICSYVANWSCTLGPNGCKSDGQCNQS